MTQRLAMISILIPGGLHRGGQHKRNEQTSFMAEYIHAGRLYNNAIPQPLPHEA